MLNGWGILKGENVKVGSPIRIPKSTMVFSGGGGREPTVTKRDSRGTVDSMFTMDWRDFVSYEIGHDWMNRRISRSFPVRYGDINLSHPEVVAEKARIDAMLGGDYEFVSWGDRYAQKSAVEVTEVKKTKEAPVTKRTHMVKGSTWRFTKDVTVTALVHPDRDSRLTAEREAWVAAGSKYDYNNPYEYYVTMPIYTVKAGTEFTVKDGKHSTMDRQNGKGLAIMVDIDQALLDFHIKFRHGDGSTGGRGMPSWQYCGENPWTKGRDRFYLPYGQIEDAVEALSVPETLIYLLKDTETNQFFAGFHEDYSVHPPKFELKMSDTVKGAKKFEKITNAHASIMNWTGYLEGMSVYQQATNTEKKADLPATWVLVPVNKITLAEGTAIDIQKWYQELMRFRDITVKFGSATRALYKKLDGTDFATIVAINSKGDWDTGDATLKAIDAAAKDTSEPILRAKSSSSVAYACSLTDAIVLKMKFDGTDGLTVGILDRTTLDEIVN